MLDFATVLRAPTFKFFIGKDGTCFNVPATLAKDISPPLYAMMSGSGMKEANDGKAELKEVECETFTAFCEYAYTGSYRVPKVSTDFEESTHGSAPHQSTIFGPGPSVVDHQTFVTPFKPPKFEWNLQGAQGIEPQSHLFGSSVTKKPTLQNKPAPAWFGEARFGDVPVRNDSDIIEGHHNRLWNAFRGLKYESLPQQSEEILKNLNRVTELEFKPLLFHCKLYLFAQMYLILSLKQLTLHNLHAALQDFHLDLASSGEVLEAIEFAFTNTERGDDHDDELRKLLVAYAASKTKTLKQNASFRTLLDAHGELGSDIIQVLG